MNDVEPGSLCLVAGTENGADVLYADSGSRQCRHRLPTEQSGAASIAASDRLGPACVLPAKGLICGYNWSGKEARLKVHARARLSKVAMSEDGQFLAAAEEGESVRLWSLMNGELLYEAKPVLRGVSSLALDCLAGVMLVGGRGGEVVGISFSMPREVARFSRHTLPVTSLASDGLVFASASLDHTLRVHCLQGSGGAELNAFRLESPVTSTCLAAEEGFALAGDALGGLSLAPLRRFDGDAVSRKEWVNGSPVESVALAPSRSGSGRLAASSCKADAPVRLWRVSRRSWSSFSLVPLRDVRVDSGSVHSLSFCSPRPFSERLSWPERLGTVVRSWEEGLSSSEASVAPSWLPGNKRLRESGCSLSGSESADALLRFTKRSRGRDDENSNMAEGSAEADHSADTSWRSRYMDLLNAARVALDSVPLWH